MVGTALRCLGGEAVHVIRAFATLQALQFRCLLDHPLSRMMTHARRGQPMQLTIALERYDRHFPFFDGTVKPRDGMTLKVFQAGQSHPARDGEDRHGRMLKGEFDAAEFSMSTYLMAIDRNLPITGVPVFPRRLFSAGLFFVRADSPLRT